MASGSEKEYKFVNPFLMSEEELMKDIERIKQENAEKEMGNKNDAKKTGDDDRNSPPSTPSSVSYESIGLNSSDEKYVEIKDHCVSIPKHLLHKRKKQPKPSADTALKQEEEEKENEREISPETVDSEEYFRVDYSHPDLKDDPEDMDAQRPPGPADGSDLPCSKFDKVGEWLTRDLQDTHVAQHTVQTGSPQAANQPRQDFRVSEPVGAPSNLVSPSQTRAQGAQVWLDEASSKTGGQELKLSEDVERPGVFQTAKQPSDQAPTLPNPLANPGGTGQTSHGDCLETSIMKLLTVGGDSNCQQDLKSGHGFASDAVLSSSPKQKTPEKSAFTRSPKKTPPEDTGFRFTPEERTPEKPTVGLSPKGKPEKRFVNISPEKLDDETSLKFSPKHSPKEGFRLPSKRAPREPRRTSSEQNPPRPSNRAPEQGQLSQNVASLRQAAQTVCVKVFPQDKLNKYASQFSPKKCEDVPPEASQGFRPIHPPHSARDLTSSTSNSTEDAENFSQERAQGDLPPDPLFRTDRKGDNPVQLSEKGSNPAWLENNVSTSHSNTPGGETSKVGRWTVCDYTDASDSQDSSKSVPSHTSERLSNSAAGQENFGTASPILERIENEEEEAGETKTTASPVQAGEGGVSSKEKPASAE